MIEKIESTFLESIERWDCWKDCEISKDPHFRYSMTKAPFPLFNTLFFNDLKGSQLEAAFQNWIQLADERRLGLSAYLTPVLKQQELLRLLEAYHFDLVEVSRAFICLKENFVSRPSISGLSISEVTERDFSNWVRGILVDVFRLPEEVVPSWKELYREIGVRYKDSWKHYWLLKNNERIGGGSIYWGKDAAYIANLGIFLTHQGQGYGRTLLRELCEEVYQRGYPEVYLSSSLNLSQFYEKEGFTGVFEGELYLRKPLARPMNR